MTTLSDAIGGGMPPRQSEISIDSARVGSGPRASVEVTERDGKISAGLKGWAASFAADVREAWWAPASLPTVQRAWANRMPDRDRVPGGNALLYGGWVGYNHTLGLAVPALATAVIGLLSMLVWAATHPARLVLTVTILGALGALIF
jgi:hypothetical protein